MLDQFREAMVFVLIIAAIIAVILSDWKDAVAIVVIVVLNASLGFIQDYRAEKAMAALKQMAAPVVKVRRGGHRGSHLVYHALRTQGECARL